MQCLMWLKCNCYELINFSIQFSIEDFISSKDNILFSKYIKKMPIWRLFFVKCSYNGAFNNLYASLVLRLTLFRWGASLNRFLGTLTANWAGYILSLSSTPVQTTLKGGIEKEDPSENIFSRRILFVKRSFLVNV